MDIWECTEKGGEKVYKCPMCRGYSYDRLNYCPTCGEHMKTENGKIKIEIPYKPSLTTKTFARMRDEKRYFKGSKK